MAVPGIVPVADTLDELCEALRGKGIRSAETDPGKLLLPGVLVELTAIRFDILAGATIVARLSLVAPDVGIVQVHETLADLLAKASGLIDPEGDVTATRVPLGEQSTPMPALQMTVTIPTT